MVRQIILACCVLPLAAQSPELGQGWLPEFELVSKQFLQLAEATPDEKFTWRPKDGVRSVSEIYMQVVLGNLVLLTRSGIVEPMGLSQLPKDFEKTLTSKADVLKWLKLSQDAVRMSVPKAKPKTRVKLFGQDTTTEGVLLRLLLHNHEHLGRQVSYAHMMDVSIPWEKR